MSHICCKLMDIITINQPTNSTVNTLSIGKTIEPPLRQSVNFCASRLFLVQSEDHPAPAAPVYHAPAPGIYI